MTDASSTVCKGERALVLGGGIAGLAAAGVLASHFERVTVLERDVYGDAPGVRPHAPQGAHVHILLAGGLLTLTRLVPELPAWFDEMGLPEGDLTYHVRLASAGRWLAKVRSGVPIRPCTRPMLEHLLLRDVLRRGNVEVLTDCKIAGLGRAPGQLDVERDGVHEQLSADLIVDASGRASSSSKWLVSAGARPVEEDIVDPGVVYTSCTFETTAPLEDDWALLGIAPQVPNDPHSGAVMRIAPNRMLVASITYGRPKPPTTPEQFVERLRDMSVSEPWQIVRDATPISAVTSFSATRNRMRHYGRPHASIERFVIIGDALCSLNPRYGQGMTVAALTAEQLGVALDRHFGRQHSLDGFAAHFHQHMERVLARPWSMALMEDQLWVSALSGKPTGLRERLTARATKRLLDAVFANVDAYIPFMRVAHMLDEPTALLSAKFVTALLRSDHGQPPPPPGIALLTPSA